VTLREALGGDVRRVRERLEDVLDSEDALIVLIDGRHATTCAQGFALSGDQLEFLAIEIERAVRGQVLVGVSPGGGVEGEDKKDGEDEKDSVDRIDRGGKRGLHSRGAAGRSCGTVRGGDVRRGARRYGAGALLRLANAAPPPDDRS
jgi:hypothetical protein